MTTSALSMVLGTLPDRTSAPPSRPPDLENHLERRQRRDLALVGRRRQLDQVEADHLRARGGCRKQVERLPSRKATRRWDLGAGCERGVEHVDVEGHVKPA